MCHTLSKSIFRSKNHKLVYGTDFVIPENKIEFETGLFVYLVVCLLTSGIYSLFTCLFTCLFT